GYWYAGQVLIQAGAESQNFKNPQEQVQAYALRIRERLIRPTQPPPWLPGKTSDWEQARIQTAVCFTHPSARLPAPRTELTQSVGHQPMLGDFNVLLPAEVADWAAALRLQLQQGRDGHFQPYRFTVEQIRRIATQL